MSNDTPHPDLTPIGLKLPTPAHVDSDSDIKEIYNSTGILTITTYGKRIHHIDPTVFIDTVIGRHNTLEFIHANPERNRLFTYRDNNRHRVVQAVSQSFQTRLC